jgi:hypothetical protein
MNSYLGRIESEQTDILPKKACGQNGKNYKQNIPN